jgi:hypothetical protein
MLGFPDNHRHFLLAGDRAQGDRLAKTKLRLLITLGILLGEGAIYSLSGKRFEKYFSDAVYTDVGVEVEAASSAKRSC